MDSAAINSRQSVKTSLSYAEPNDPWFTKLIINMLELFTGKSMLERKCDLVLNRDIHPSQIMGEALKELNITLELDKEKLAQIPSTGPLIFIANHPFGVVDGLAMGEIVSRVRSGFSILVNAVLCRNPQLDPYLLPIDFRTIPEATKINLATRQAALSRLASGEAVAIFPSGAVATAPFPGKDPVDLEWKRFLIRLVTQSDATVIPLYFHGRNSFWFQLASYIHLNLRLGLLLYEVKNKMNRSIRITIGDPIKPEILKTKKPNQELLSFLREATLSLAVH
jgi:putative hemolysin